VQVVVKNGSATSAPFTVQDAALSTSFFVFNGGPYVIATHLNGTIIGPSALFPGFSTPATPAETIIIYGNGFGTTSQPILGGSVAQGGTLSPLPVIKVGGLQANVTFAGLVSPGLYQFNVDLPASLPDGDATITASYNGSTTQAGTLLTIRR
jgi:uncharacterized protein (TIGR03437 family)